MCPVWLHKLSGISVTCGNSVYWVYLVHLVHLVFLVYLVSNDQLLLLLCTMRPALCPYALRVRQCALLFNQKDQTSKRNRRNCLSRIKRINRTNRINKTN